MTFESLELSAPLQKALAAKNYSVPSPIQEQTIPLVLAGRDVFGCAQTGTGKTAAFALPILEHLAHRPKARIRRTPRVLILAPTRELAAQIRASFDAYGSHLPFRAEAIFGGVSPFHQIRGLERGPEIVVATPGRLLDHMRGRAIQLEEVEILVIDEADRMLDMGFLPDVRKIVERLPKQRQTLFFSATMPAAIQELAGTILKDPARIEVTPAATTAEKIDQRLFHVPRARKRELLTHVLSQEKEGLALVFAGTKHGANRLAEQLAKDGIPADAIHGNKSQSARQRALENFRQGRVRVLVATDIAARGIDVKGISLVLNYDLPKEPDAYVHRIGRTARAGAEGRAISFCSEGERGLLRQIERNIRQAIPVDDRHPFHGEIPQGSAPAQQPKAKLAGDTEGTRGRRRWRPRRGMATAR